MSLIFRSVLTLMAAVLVILISATQLFSQPDSLVVYFSRISASGEVDNPSIELEWEVWRKRENKLRPYSGKVEFNLTISECTETEGDYEILPTITLADKHYTFKENVKLDQKYRFKLALSRHGIVDITEAKYNVGFITLYKKRKISWSGLYKRVKEKITESQIGKFFKYGGKPPFYISYLLSSIFIIGFVSFCCKLFSKKGNSISVESHRSSLKFYRVMRAIAESFSSPEFFQTFWKVALMLGLFGTVSGISKAFGKVNILSSFTPRKDLIKSLSGGINEALYTTIGGLIVGISFMAFYYLLKQGIRIDLTKVWKSLKEGARKCFKNTRRVEVH